MTIRKKAKEELLNQAEWFLEYAKENWKLDKKTEKEISKILWLNEDEKRWFLERLSSKFWKELDISDKWEIEKVLKKKHIDFDGAWREYTEYLRLKSKEKHLSEIKEKVRIFFEPYKTPFDEVNERIIDVIVENYSKDAMERARIFFTSNLYEFAREWAIKNETFFKDFMECVDKSDDLIFLLRSFSCDELFEARISKSLKNIDISVLKSSVFILNKYGFDYKQTWLKDLESLDVTKFESNILALKENWYDYKKTSLSINDLEYIDVLEYIKILEDCNVAWFWEDFDMNNEHYEDLNNVVLKFKYMKKEHLLSVLVKIWINKVNKILWKCPDIKYENNGWYRTKTVHMFASISEMRDFISDNKNEYGRHNNIKEIDRFLYYIWVIYWTNNWKENIDLVYEKGLIDSKEIVDDARGWNNKKIAHLKIIKNEILEKLLRNWVSDEDFNVFVMDLDDLNYEILTVLLEKWSDITIKDFNSMKKILKSHNSECLKMILAKRDNITKEELIWLEDTISLSYEGNLKTIFEKYPSIRIWEIPYINKLLEERSYELLKIIFEKYPNISYKELQFLKLKWFWYVNRRALWFNISNLCDCIKILFEFYPDITIKQLSLINLKATNSINNWFKWGTLSRFLKYFGPVELMDLNKYKKLLGAYLSWLVPKFKEVNKLWYVKYIEEIIDTYYDSNKKVEMIKKICTLTFNEAENYLKIFKMLDNSISMDIQRVKNELMDEILDSDNPEETAETIVKIFEKNNLPLTWKIFKVFELLYPKEKLNNQLNPDSWLWILWSPVLNSFREWWKLKEWRWIYDLIYKDLMNIAIKSWDRSLREYLKTFIWSEQLLRDIETIINEKWFNPDDNLCLEWKLDEEEQAQLLYLFRKILVLYNRYFWKEIFEGDWIESIKAWKTTVIDSQLVKLYNEIKKWFNLKGKNHSLYDKLRTLLYINWLKYYSPEDVLDKMDETKRQAHERWLKLYNEAVWWKIDFPKHAFVKWVDEYAFSKIINRWITSREYLWWWDDWKDSWGQWWTWASSDATPFDIDWYYVDKPTESSYWLVNLVVNTDRWDFVETTIDENPEGLKSYKENQYELFKTWWWTHYWIRTWIPTTEIDYIIYRWSFNRTEKVLVKTGEHP